ncbi:uncharacterized protein LOC119690237 [Teleopsis dalmanni]|uniref:uncharacterized protein LOC119690237 n=1 Tax=Teleopsis dalmanni TaxID=139649 RepID=UPI0018CFC924|nr:uncharacterized protein LOC119690237 [Teleopsis dalmanni]
MFTILANTILIGVAGYGIYHLKAAEVPFAYSACAYGLCHGIIDLVSYLKQECNFCQKIKEMSGSIMRLMPISMVNIEFYLKSEESKSLAFCHAFFVVPLIFEVLVSFFAEDEREISSADTLKDLTILGNIISLIFLSLNERNVLYGVIAMIEIVTNYSYILTERFYDDADDDQSTLGHILFYYFVIKALL